MKITMRLDEILEIVDDIAWEQLCKAKGYDVYVVNEGGGNIEVDLTKDEAEELGIINLPV